jgi:hypothetical protein
MIVTKKLCENCELTKEGTSKPHSSLWRGTRDPLTQKPGTPHWEAEKLLSGQLFLATRFPSRIQRCLLFRKPLCFFGFCPQNFLLLQ